MQRLPGTGDHPPLDAGVVAVLLHACQNAPAGSILVPTVPGRRGHPAFLADLDTPEEYEKLLGSG